ncbi:MAG: hypothetical protein ACRDRL_18105 [Sciscionella sp.]
MDGPSGRGSPGDRHGGEYLLAAVGEALPAGRNTEQQAPRRKS